MNLNQITLPAIDVAVSAAFYRRMGFRQIVDGAPGYARFECQDGGSTFSLHQVSKTADRGWTVYFECEDLDATVVRLENLGFRFKQEPRDEPWLWREARLEDPSGNEVCLYHAGENRRFPPWRLAAQPAD
ncbi:MAG: VOC family protein [Xanthomonadales bacterium]|nr:VOC family protein [Xanthomonadales bacterium]